MCTRNLLLIPVLAALACCTNSSKDSVDPLSALYANNRVVSNATYYTEDSIPLHLDVYVPAKRLGEPPWIEYTETLKPVLVNFHGGGWTGGDKISRSLELMPYLGKGWCVVNVDYRLLDRTSVVGCIRDVRHALDWVYDNAPTYKFDTTKIVVSGESAGGHLALMAGFVKNNSIFPDGDFPPRHQLKVAAVLDWFGVSDLAAESKTWDSTFLKQVIIRPQYRDSIFRIASPVTYIDKDSPPVVMVHGDKDPAAPYEQALILQDHLNKAGVRNKLITIAGKKHGNFDSAEMTHAHQEIYEFLESLGIK